MAGSGEKGNGREPERPCGEGIYATQAYEQELAPPRQVMLVIEVIQKLIPDAPHEVLLVLDASTGQNAIEQAKQFTLATEVNALAITKLDGTAKGGVVIGISDQFKIPVKYIGVGEGIEDLQVFNKNEFVNSLFNS